MSYMMNKKVSVDYTQMGVTHGEPGGLCSVVSRTSFDTSIFRAELHAIMLAMKLIRKRKEKNFLTPCQVFKP